MISVTRLLPSAAVAAAVEAGGGGAYEGRGWRGGEAGPARGDADGTNSSSEIWSSSIRGPREPVFGSGCDGSGRSVSSSNSSTIAALRDILCDVVW